MPSTPRKTVGVELTGVIIQEASKCRLEAMSSTGEGKWALLAMAEELEELDHALRMPATRLPWEAR